VWPCFKPLSEDWGIERFLNFTMAVNSYQILGNSGREKEMNKHLMRLWKEEEGQDLTEYALLLVLIALAAVTVMGTLGNAINNVFSTGASDLTSAAT
jgi:pilus assembly protein Flp/PilA